MAIIKSERSSKKEKIKAEISTDILSTITSYCEWADISDLGFFIEEAACFVFAKDKDWKDYQKKSKKAKKLKPEIKR